MTKTTHSWMSTPNFTSSLAWPSHRLPSGLSRHAAGKRAANPRSRIENFLQTSSVEPDSCQELPNGVQANLRAEVELSYGIDDLRRNKSSHAVIARVAAQRTL